MCGFIEVSIYMNKTLTAGLLQELKNKGKVQLGNLKGGCIAQLLMEGVACQSFSFKGTGSLFSLLINQNAIFLPGHAVSSMKAI